MALLPASIDYTDRDFDALRSRLIALVQSVFPDWSDFDVASFGTILLELVAFVGDVLGYYQDSLARESRLVTATQRQNVIALAKMFGYKLAGARAATADVEIRLAAPPAASVTVPAGTVVRTQEVTEPIRFQMLADAVIPAGANPPVVIASVENSKTYTQLFDAQGLPDLQVFLDYAPFLDGSSLISTPQGQWREVDTFLDSSANDRDFTVVVDQADRATVRFGNGTNGAAPSGTISVAYKTGGGAAGRVDPGRLVVLEGSFADAFGNPVQASVRNPLAATGGADRQTVAAAQQLIPASLRTLTRSVSREDFETNVLKLGTVARALMLTQNEDPTIAENSGILYVIPKGGGLPTSTLKAQALAQVTEVYPCTLTFQPSVLDPVYRTIDIVARIFIREGVSPAVVRDRIRTNLQNYFRISNPDGTPNTDIDFGFHLRDEDGTVTGEIAWSDVFNTIRDSTGVRKVSRDMTLNGLPADVALAAREFPQLGSVTLLDGDTGAIL